MAGISDSEGRAGPSKREVEPEVQRYFRIIQERRWIVAAALLVGLVLFGLWASRQPRIYLANASIIVDYSPPQVFAGEVRDVQQVGPGQYYAMSDYIQTQKRVLASDKLARKVITRLHLLDDKEFWAGPPPANVEDAIRAFAGNITAEPVTDTQIIVVAYRHTIPAQAKRAADGLVDTYIESNLEMRDTSNLSASHWLADEADVLRTKLSSAEMALYDFKHKNDLLSVSLEDKVGSVQRQIDRLTDALTEVRLRKVQRSTESEELAKMSQQDPTSIVPAAAHTGGDTLTNLKGDLSLEERKLSELQARYEEAHPLVRQQLAKVHAVRASVLREVALQLRGAQARVNEAVEQEKKIAVQLDQARQEGLRVTRLEVDYMKLKREAEALGKQYILVQARTKETELAAKIKTNNLHVLDYARIPSVPISPHLYRSGVLALFFALAVGILLAFLLDALDRTLKTQEDVESKLAVPFLGAVPHVPSSEAPGRFDLHVADNPQSAAAECCRLIRTNLLFAGVSRPLKRLLITSPLAREGKTMTSISLAAVFAQAGQKVLLIDSDLRRPRLKSALGMDAEVGLTNVLLETVQLEDAIQPTTIPNLFVLLSGPVPPNPAELVDGPRFREVLEQCAEKFERVIIDSPPAVPVTDPAILATYCDGVVLVVRSGRTQQDHAQRARRNLADVGARIIGVVLNDTELSRGGYGGYRYGYGYGYTYGPSKKQVSKTAAAEAKRKRA
jgi:polysaccharide biosynthesis transport protein